MHLNITVPKKLSREQKQAVESLAAEHFPDQADLTFPGETQKETKQRRRGGGLFDRIRDALESD